MGGEGEDLEPLFDYHRVQPSNFVCIDDDDSDVSEVRVKKRSKISQKFVKEDEDVKVIEVAGDDDWLPPPPKVVFDKSKESGEDSTIKALRSKKMELMSYANTVVDVRQEAEESAKKEAEEVSVRPSSEAAAQAPQGVYNERAKIIITVQDKDGQKQFRVYADEKFERVFKMYTDKEKLDPRSLVFTFDGDKINPSTTPSNLEMEEGDMIEVHTKKR